MKATITVQMTELKDSWAVSMAITADEPIEGCPLVEEFFPTEELADAAMVRVVEAALALKRRLKAEEKAKEGTVAG